MAGIQSLTASHASMPLRIASTAGAPQSGQAANAAGNQSQDTLEVTKTAAKGKPFYAPGTPFSNASPETRRELGLPDNWNDMPHLQRHIAFFDKNGDDRATGFEIYKGFKSLGLEWYWSVAAGVLIPWSEGSKTGGSLLEGVKVSGFRGGIHPNEAGDGGRTGIFDANGWVDADRFNQIWTEFDPNGDNRVYPDEIENLLTAIKGEKPSKRDFKFLMKVVGEKGYATKQDIVHTYDGTLFYRVAKAGS